MPQPPGDQGRCHLSSDEATALGKEGRGPAFHPLPTQVLHTPIHFGGPGLQQWLVLRTLNNCGSDYTWLLHSVSTLEMWAEACVRLVPVSLSPWAGGHRWEEVTTARGTVCSLSPLVHRTTTSRRVESLLCPLYYLPNLNATAPSVTSHLLQVLSKQYRLLPCLSTKQA